MGLLLGLATRILVFDQFSEKTFALKIKFTNSRLPLSSYFFSFKYSFISFCSFITSAAHFLEALFNSFEHRPVMMAGIFLFYNFRHSFCRLLDLKIFGSIPEGYLKCSCLNLVIVMLVIIFILRFWLGNFSDHTR